MIRSTVRFAWALLLAGAGALGSTAHAQEPFDFSRIPGVEAGPKVDINLTPILLGFVAEAARNADPDTASILGGLQRIRVNVYEGIGDDVAALLEFVDSASAALERDGWERVVYVQDGEDRVRVYMKSPEEEAPASPTVTGLTVMVADSGGDAVFVSIGGNIDPTQLGRIVGAVGMGGMLDGLDIDRALEGGQASGR